MSKLQPIVSGVLAIDPAAPAVEYEGRWRSWGELDALIAALDRTLSERKLDAGTRVGAILRSRPELISVMAAVFCSDRCLVTLNPTAPDAKLAEDILRTKPAVVAALAQDWAREPLREAAGAIGCLALELTGDPADPLRVIQELAATHDKAPGVALEMLTSGTTGPPKRIPLAAKSFEKTLLDAALYESGRGANDAPRLRGGVQILTSPFAHTAGVQAVMNALLAGRQSCLLERFTVEGFVDAIRRHRPKVASCTPAGVRMIMDAEVPRESLASLVALRTGAAALDPDLADAFYERFGVPILQNYGATEFGAVAGWTPDDFRTLFAAKRGSVGRMNAGIEARVVDSQSGAPLAPGETGLLELRAPHIGDGAWLRTSDLATLDEDRFLWIKGRADGAIVRGGFKIQPEEVAAVLASHPAVSEAVVIGLADARLGQLPVAAFTCAPGSTAPADDDLRAFLRDRLMPYQVPARFQAVTELPRTDSMKVSLVGVRALFEPT